MLGLGFQVEGWVVMLVLMAVAQVAVIYGEFFEPFNVSYDHRALILGGQRRMLISAGIHYPRATPDMWPGLIAKSKEGGADVIETYVFWSGHEPSRGQYYFEERYDIVKFVKLVGANGLYLLLRIGPYVCAEWNFGGFPVWLRDVPDIEFRTDNAPFKDEMQRFAKKIVDLMKEENLFSWQGGPIILTQIENEYGNVQGSYGQSGERYMKWAAGMALGLGAGVPWIMCRQTDAPEAIINSCNAFYCDGFKPNSYRKPVIWTEDWNGWYANWGDRLPHRPVEDNAFAIARFFQRGGSFHNYYMYFGGTNFERTAGGPLQITSYNYDAPIDEYGILNQPKWGHLKDLHKAIKLCEPALVAVDDSPLYVKLGRRQEAHVYSSEQIDTNSTLPGNIGTCAAFLANIDEHKSASVKIFGKVYNLPPWSVSILPDCKTVAFNTAKTEAQVSIKTVESGSPSLSNATEAADLLFHDNYFAPLKSWMASKEPIGLWNKNSFSAKGILEHLNVTKDTSDYLWYITSVNISAEDVLYWKEKGILPLLKINSMRDVVRIFVNGELAGSKVGHWLRLEQHVQLVEGDNQLALLSETVGLQNYGAFIEKDGAGFRGPIKLTGFRNYGSLDLTKFLWTYQVGLKGEAAKYYAPEEQENVDWVDLQLGAPSAFIWYKTYFDAPEGSDPVAIDLGSMGKGFAWINGHGLGRYWSLVAPKSGCPKTCDYRGTYKESKCVTNCGQLTQSWYHIPREWLQDSNNLLVIFEETGGNPLKISLKTHYTKTICAKVSENDYPPLNSWWHPNIVSGKKSVSDVPPEIHLRCDDGHVISGITFASFGNSGGSCQKFSVGHCHASSSLSVVQKACLGKNKCKVSVSNATFGKDPCRGTLKSLAVEAECTSSSNFYDFHAPNLWQYQKTVEESRESFSASA
ncbi:Beta-galactosidase protein [Dioscorea alata]|uniref:Beta-galactosidase protein n=1 Tax=Dioscorea alata TaxID=55571 RepID=A0ACB7V9T5_DIOAL|nr:Beta-galactosidase protein [Dioscorea alata]